MKKIYLLLTTLFTVTCLNVNAQQVEPQKQTVTIDIDNYGDGHISITRFYNASRWENYINIYGTNALDLLKREEERSLPGWYLQNWSYKDDGAEHTWTLSFDALGIAKIDENGNWVLDLDQKKPDITKISDHNFALTTTFNSYGNLMETFWKINFPSGAANVNPDKDAFGKAIFTYEMTPGGKAGHFLFIIFGILLVASGVVFYLKPDVLKFGKREKVKPFTVVSAQQAAAQEPPAATPNIEKQA